MKTLQLICRMAIVVLGGVGVAATGVALGGPGGVALAAAPAGAAPSTWYAYPSGGAASPMSCPPTTTRAEQCTLSQALSLAQAGDTVALAVGGNEGDPSTYYVGNFSVSTSGTSAASPVTIEPAAGVSDPILDGNGGSATNCPTAGCNGPVLAIEQGIYATVSGLIIQHGDNTSTGNGGGIFVGNAAHLAVSASTFSDNAASQDGGAIDAGDGSVGGFNNRGYMTITSSTFSTNTAVDGGAVDIGDHFGIGTLSVTSSTFWGNQASDAGGAIDLGNDRGGALVTITSSTFSGNPSAPPGSPFTGNAANFGGAIASAGGPLGHGSLTVTSSTFAGNAGFGEDIGNGRSGGEGRLSVVSSTFAPGPDSIGPAIENDDSFGGFSEADIALSTFAGGATAIDSRNGGTVVVASDLFAGPCLPMSVPTQRSLWSDNGYNVGRDASCLRAGAQGDINAGSSLPALLGPLADHGGATQTVALLPGNPAIGAMPFGAGPCPISSDQRGVASPAGRACDAGAVQLAGQTVSFTSTPPTSPTAGGAPYLVSATSTSGLPVKFSVAAASAGVCAVSGDVVSFTGAGTCVIDADQPGDNASGSGNWLAAPQVTQSFTVTDTDLTIAPPHGLTTRATGPSGVAVNYPLPKITDEDATTPSATCSPASGSQFPIGTTTVRCAVNDADDSPLTATTAFTVTVLDTDLAISTPANITTDATGPRGATVTYPLPAVSDEDSSQPNAACFPASSSLFPIGTTTVTCTTSDRDDTPSTATSTFSVTVAGASAQLSSLRRAVQRAGHTNVLARTVARAQALLAAGRTRATCLTLGAFQREVGGLSHRFIAAAEARALIIDARRIQSVLACSPATGGHGRRLGAVASRAARVLNEPSRARRSSHRTT